MLENNIEKQWSNAFFNEIPVGDLIETFSNANQFCVENEPNDNEVREISFLVEHVLNTLNSELLSPRQRQILVLFLNGFTERESGELLKIHYTCVREYKLVGLHKIQFFYRNTKNKKIKKIISRLFPDFTFSEKIA